MQKMMRKTHANKEKDLEHALTCILPVSSAVSFSHGASVSSSILPA
jgi:hypothetical protein